MPTVLGFVVIALASYRATRIFTDDSITETWRGVLFRWAWDKDNPVEVDVEDHKEWRAQPRASWRTYVYELLTCAFCLGIWVTAVLYVLWQHSGSSAVRAGMVILAAAGIQAFLQARTEP